MTLLPRLWGPIHLPFTGSSMASAPHGRLPATRQLICLRQPTTLPWRLPHLAPSLLQAKYRHKLMHIILGALVKAEPLQ